MLPKICAVPECPRVHRARGWCKMHYTRWMLWGDVGPASRTYDTKPVTCAFQGCERKHHAKSWCRLHYEQMRRTGKTSRARESTLARESTFEELFWAKVEKSEGCWNWTSVRNDKGYGRLHTGGKGFMAHRIAYELTKGLIPDGMQIDHRCHNKACVKPAHLRVVTPKQNMENQIGPYANSKSGVRGVIWVPKSSKWLARVGHHGVKHRLGLFETLDEAEVAAVAKRLELFTHNDLDRVMV